LSRPKRFTAKEAKIIGEKLGIDWKAYDVEQFRMGMEVELEHGTVSPVTNVTDDDPILTGKIALAHLNEFPDYYTRLEILEEEATAALRKRKKEGKPV
jgi:DNA-directed RNA polymerase alpha subunit